MSGVAPRYKTSETAMVQIYGRPGEIVSRLKNISSTGALFELINGHKIPKRGEFVHIIVHLTSLNKSYALNAQVVWNHGPLFGVSFIKKDHLADALLKSL